MTLAPSTSSQGEVRTEVYELNIDFFSFFLWLSVRGFVVSSAGSEHTVIFAFFLSYSAAKGWLWNSVAFPQNY